MAVKKNNKNVEQGNAEPQRNYEEEVDTNGEKRN